jgi:hypothetical protein
MAQNILIGCDQKYYDQWATTLLRSIHYYAPWVNLHCHVVNPTKLKKLSFVNYTTEEKEFKDNVVKIGYLQAVRFLKAYELFPNDEPVLILDADSICTRSFNERLFDAIHQDNPVVLRKEKTNRWLAGFISLGTSTFRKDYYKLLTKKPIDQWAGFWDQQCLKKLSYEYDFIQCPTQWMSIGKNGNQSIFLTLKGDQKTSEKFLPYYNEIKRKIC